MIRFLILSMILFGCSPGCGSKSVDEETSQPDPIHWTECGFEVGDHACDFTLQDQNGKDWNLYSHYGEVIVLDFATEWCGYCHVAAEETQATQDEISKDTPFSYVTVLIEDMAGNSPPTLQAQERWCTHYNITAPVLAGNRDMIVSEYWNITGFPTFYILNSDLVIVEIIRGWSSAALEKAIQEAIDSEIADTQN